MTFACNHKCTWPRRQECAAFQYPIAIAFTVKYILYRMSESRAIPIKRVTKDLRTACTVPNVGATCTVCDAALTRTTCAGILKYVRVDQGLQSVFGCVRVVSLCMRGH